MEDDKKLEVDNGFDFCPKIEDVVENGFDYAAF